MIEEITTNSVGGTPVEAEKLVVDMPNSSLPDLRREKAEALVRLISPKSRHLPLPGGFMSGFVYLWG